MSRINIQRIHIMLVEGFEEVGDGDVANKNAFPQIPGLPEFGLQLDEVLEQYRIHCDWERQEMGIYLPTASLPTSD